MNSKLECQARSVSCLQGKPLNSSKIRAMSPPTVRQWDCLCILDFSAKLQNLREQTDWKHVNGAKFDPEFLPNRDEAEAALAMLTSGRRQPREQRRLRGSNPMALLLSKSFT